MLTLLLEPVLALGYFPDPTKLLFICNSPTQEGSEKHAFEAEGMAINVVPGR